MTITVLAPAFYSDPEWSTRYLRRSAARHNVPIKWYGAGEPYRGWLDVQLVRLLAELRQVDTSHVLYTDSSDALFLSGLGEIEDRYITDFGNPKILISVERSGDGGVNAGGWMGQTSDAIAAVEWLLKMDVDESNPQLRWRRAISAGSIPAEADVDQDIFQAGGELRPRMLWWQPCLWHACGGYTDPKVGKAALIEPVWRELGYERTVEL